METNENSGEKYVIVAKCDPYNAPAHYQRGAKVLEREGGTPVEWVHSDNYGHLFTKEEALKELEKYAREMAWEHDDLEWQDNESVHTLEEEVREQYEDAAYKATWYKGEGLYTTCEPEKVYLIGDTSIAYDTMTWGVEEYIN